MDLTSIHKLQCPKCGQTMRFRVDLTVKASLDNMAVYNYELPSISMQGEAICSSCNHIGTVEDFYESAQAASVSSGVIGDALNRL